jgi:hypothetical protein
VGANTTSAVRPMVARGRFAARPYGESHDREGAPTYRHDHSSRSIHERRMQLSTWERAYQCLLGDGRRAAGDLGRGASNWSTSHSFRPSVTSSTCRVS